MASGLVIGLIALVIIVIFIVVAVVIVVLWIHSSNSGDDTDNNITPPPPAPLLCPLAAALSPTGPTGPAGTPTGLPYAFADSEVTYGTGANSPTYNNAVGWMVFNRSCQTVNLYTSFNQFSPFYLWNKHLDTNEFYIWTGNTVGNEDSPENSVIYLDQVVTAETSDGTSIASVTIDTAILSISDQSDLPTVSAMITITDVESGGIAITVSACTPKDTVTVPTNVTC